MSNVIEEIRAGNKEAVKQVYQEHAKDVYNFAKSITGSHETALEATKKTFMELFSRIQKGDNPSNIRTAALKIAYDEACNIAMPSSSHFQDAPSGGEEPVFGAHRPRQKSTEELYAEVEAKRAINPTFSNTPRVYDTEIPAGQAFNPEQMNNNRVYNEPAPSADPYVQQAPEAPYMQQQPQDNPYVQQRPEAPYMQQQPQDNPYVQQKPEAPYMQQQPQDNPYIQQRPDAPYMQQQSQDNPYAQPSPFDDGQFYAQGQQNPMRQAPLPMTASNQAPDMQYYSDNQNPEYGGDFGPSNFIREDIYVPKGGYESMQVDPSQGAPDFSERFKTVNFGVVNAEVNADGDINEYDDADYRQRQIRAQRRDRQQQQDYYYEDEYDDTNASVSEEDDEIEEKPKKKGLFVFCIIINIILILILIWFLVGLLINLEIIKEINLGYEWFNAHIYPLF